MSEYFKLPRIYINGADGTVLQNDGVIDLPKEQAHYLLTVLRRQNGDRIRIFNGLDGEWVAAINAAGKKHATLVLETQIAPQPPLQKQIHLYFAPIKKDRLAFLIEKSVELGVTDFHPVITAHTENRTLNTDKIHKQIVEAAEQCERLAIPQWHEPVTFETLSRSPHPIYVATERVEGIAAFKGGDSLEQVSIFVGPEGGWSKDEKAQILSGDPFIPVSLGDAILRAETAVIVMLAQLTY